MSAIGLLVAGAGPAALAAATAYREHGGAGRIVLLAPEGRPPYERPALSKQLLRGEASEDDLPLASRARLDELGVELRSAEAVGLDPIGRRVQAGDGARLDYERCVLATGAMPVVPDVPGARLPGVHVLRSAVDALALRDHAATAARAVVVGSGFIGCEAAASLRARGCEVALVSQEPAPQLERLGGDVAARVGAWLAEVGVSAHHDVELRRIDAVDGALRVTASHGDPLDADLVLLALGVRPVTGFAQRAGVALAEGGEIAVDARQRTGFGGVLACGDCCRAHHAVAGRALHVEHWGDALAQGAVAGAVAAGADDAWTTVPGFWSTIGDHTLKHAAWGDGHDEIRVVDHGAGAFTAWYGRDGRCVGVLTHECDEDYERGRDRVAAGEPLP